MNINNPKFYLVPRWAGNIHSDWYDWVTAEIKSKYQIEIYRLNMPDWHEPNVETSLQYLCSIISEIDENTFFIGHSVGCQAILRYLNKKFTESPHLKIGGFLFVAAWFTVDKPWISLKPWMNNQDINLGLIANNVLHKKVVLSDNDPFTSNYTENKKFWETSMNAHVEICPNQLHFNRSKEPEILEALEMLISL